MIRRVLLILWVLCALSVLALFFMTGNDSEGNVLIWLCILMVALSFPSGILLVWILPLHRFHYGFGPILLWLMFLAVGYAQWFVLVPWAWRKLRGK